MAVPTQNCFPASITAGDTTRVRLSFGDYPATTWSAVLKLNQAGGDVLSMTGSADSEAFLFTITAAMSAKMAAGQWTWAVRVTGSGDTATARAGGFVVLADPAASIEKSKTQQQLDAANDALLILVGNPEATVSFNGQEFTKANESNLMDVIQRLESKLERENAKALGLHGDAPSRSIRPYFVA